MITRCASCKTSIDFTDPHRVGLATCPACGGGDLENVEAAPEAVAWEATSKGNGQRQVSLHHTPEEAATWCAEQRARKPPMETAVRALVPAAALPPLWVVALWGPTPKPPDRCAACEYPEELHSQSGHPAAAHTFRPDVAAGNPAAWEVVESRLLENGSEWVDVRTAFRCAERDAGGRQCLGRRGHEDHRFEP